MFVGRFRLVYLVLALLVGGAVGSFIVLSGNGNSSSGPSWSTWKPEGDSTQQIAAIADFVGRRYRVDDGRKLVAVDVQRPPTVPLQQLPVQYVVLYSGSGDQNAIALPAEDTVAYVLCGDGPECSIASGTPSAERGQLLRREALELALYTFKYVSGIRSVVALLPPRQGTDPRYAVFFTKDGLEPALDEPLASTLPSRQLLTPNSLNPLESSSIERYADPYIFQYTYGSGDGGVVYMALQPPQLGSGSDSGQQTQPPAPPPPAAPTPTVS